MKKRKTVLLATSLFAVVANMNGCGVYGPPEEFDPRWNIEQPAYGVPYYYEEPAVTVALTEAGWYKLTKRSYAVLRIVSVPPEVPEGEDAPAEAVYGIEMLAFYDGNGADLSNVSGISLRFEERYLFSEGEILFVELGAALQENDEVIYRVQYDRDRPVCTWFVSDGETECLEIIQGFKEQECYDYLYDFNAYTEWNYKVNQAGASENISTEPVYFEDGLTVEGAKQFFDAIAKAQEEYENVSESE